MLHLSSITKIIKETKILDRLDLKISDEEIVALTGESGSGKSTILQILGLLTSINNGKIFLDGKDCTNLSSRDKNNLRKKIGFIHQFHHLLPEFNVLENLIIPQVIFGTKKTLAVEKAHLLLKQFNLSNLEKRKPHELSGGQNQRIAILRAFINKPLIVLADEPTGNLDKKNAEEIFNFILENSKNHTITTVIVTHNNELAKKTDRIIKMEDLIKINYANSPDYNINNINHADESIQ